MVTRLSRDFRAPLRLCRYSQKRHLYWALLAGAMILGRVALLPILPIPQPTVHDEFSHLLAADTFAHGRAANPAPAHAEFFESPHILVNPTYASKFPPGQGLVMALGEKLTGHPYWGVVLSVALMIFLFCWAADAWLPPQWALIAGGLSAVLFFVRHYWFESYWGGALAAAGGALLVGGLGHVLRGRPSKAGISFAAGVLLLFSTRVYEGGVLCLAILLALLVVFWRASAPEKKSMLHALLLPNLALLALAVPLAAWYNVKVTGHATELPYTLYMRQYDLVPPLWILPPYSEKQFSSVNYSVERKWELDMYNYARGAGWLGNLPLHLAFLLVGAVWQQFLAFGLLLLAIPWARMGGRKKWLVFLLGAGIAGLLPEVMNFPHYTAPFTCVLLILIVAAGRAVWYRMSALRLRGPLAALAMIVLFTFLVMDYLSALQTPHQTQRSILIQRLESTGGRHLVFVDYAAGWPAWEPNTEWVYNGADLNATQVLFAHLRSDAENRELMSDYKDRAAWRVKVGPAPSDVTWEPYAKQPEASALRPLSAPPLQSTPPPHATIAP